jgi:hypothetical protein
MSEMFSGISRPANKQKKEKKKGVLRKNAHKIKGYFG